MRLAQSTVDPDKSVVVIVGPAEKLKKELEAIAPVTVVTPGTTEPPAIQHRPDDE